MHVLVHTQPGGVRGGGAALLMHKVASLHQALPALPPAMYFVFSRAWRTVKVNCAAHGARPSLDTPRHKSQRVFGLRNHDSQRLGSKECSVRRDCGFRHRRLGGSKAGPATQKLRAFLCTGPRRPAVHTAREVRGARPGTFYLKKFGKFVELFGFHTQFFQICVRFARFVLKTEGTRRTNF